MIQSKYFILLILFIGLLFQYFKYRSVPNQKFLAYLSYFEKLSLVNKNTSVDTRFLVGFESIKYFIFKNLTISDNEDLRKHLCFSEISTEDEFQCALFKASRNDYYQKYFVKNETLFKSILGHSAASTSQRLGGSGVNFARQLAYLKHTEVMLASTIEKSSLQLLPNNIKVTGVLETNRKIGLRRNGLIALYSDRRKAVFDRAGLTTLVEDFQLVNGSLLQEFSPHCLVIGRLPKFRTDSMDRVIPKLEQLSRTLAAVPSGVVVHHQLGHIDSVAAGRLLLRQFVPHLDSIDLGLIEMHQLHGLARLGHFSAEQYSSDLDTSLKVLDDLWNILNSGSFSARAGTRRVSRIHLRAHDYHVLMVAVQSSQFYLNLRHALAKGVMGQLQARCHRKMAVLKDIVHFYLEDEFFQRHRNGNVSSFDDPDPIKCWSRPNAYEICVSPVPTCFELKHTLEDAEVTAAAALAAQIKIPLHDDVQ